MPASKSFDYIIIGNGLAGFQLALALAEDGTIEALAHIKLPWVGIMWHPERENASEDKNNITLIKKVFFDLNKKFK